jgi:Fe-S oxidoreductase
METFGRRVNEKAEYVFFMGCVGQYREEDATEATLDVLDHLKVDYTLIEEVCCTGVLEDVGHSIHKDKADHNLAMITATGAKKVITACPYCFRTFKNKEAYAPVGGRGNRGGAYQPVPEGLRLGREHRRGRDLSRPVRFGPPLRHL